MVGDMLLRCTGDLVGEVEVKVEEVVGLMDA